MDYPLVSIIVPSYNHKRFLPFLLASLESESYPNTEIVVIDDGSTDGSWEVIRQWAEQWGKHRQVQVLSRSNKGVTRTLNDLVDKASGEFVTAIHSDDYLLPGGIEKRVRYLMQHPEKHAVFGNCIAIDEQGNRIADSAIDIIHQGRTHCFMDDESLKREIIERWAVPGGTLMVRRDYYKGFRYNENFVIEDFDLFLKLVSQNHLGFLPEPVSASRVHAFNTSRSDSIWVKVQEDIIQAGWNNLRRFPLPLQWRLFRKLMKLSWPVWKYRTKQKLKKITLPERT